MRSILGIDVGTSSLKVMLMEKTSGVIGVRAENYDVSIPKTGYGEQDPKLWWGALLHCLERLREEFPQEYEAVEAIGFSGQMHGLVAVDQEGEPVRPAILWMDKRSVEECTWIQECISSEEIQTILHNRIFPGFAFPSLVWMKNHEPELYARIHKIMQPKDYIRYKLTGKPGTEVTDASASLMLDVKKRRFAFSLLERCGIRTDIFPECGESGQVHGTLTKEMQKTLGFLREVQIVYGMGDQQAQSIGNGAVKEGMLICNIGTGAQISTFSETDRYDPKLRTHTFCHGILNAYTIFGASLNGGIALKWLKNNILEEESFQKLSQMADEIAPGSEGLFFLPYLSGERSPHMNADAKGMFWGLQLSHDRRHMARAVMEGITFGLKDTMLILEEMGIQSELMIASGGAAASEVWLQILADIFEKEIMVCEVAEQACLGACIGAGVGTGMFQGIEEACKQFVSFGKKHYYPKAENTAIYREAYTKFRELYKANEKYM